MLCHPFNFGFLKFFSFAYLQSAPAYHLMFGAEIGSKLEAPAGKSQSSYMLWSDYERTKEVILELWSKMKTLSRSAQENSTGDYYTRIVIGGAGMLLVLGCFVMKITKLRDLISSVSSYGWNPQPTSMALNNLGGVRIWKIINKSDTIAKMNKWIIASMPWNV